MSRRSQLTATNSVDVVAAKKRLTKYLKTLDTRPTEILENSARHLYSEIYEQTPLKTGRLRRSIRVRVSKDKRRPGINASAHAINPETHRDYSWYQHEMTTYKHRIGKDHFISDPFSLEVTRLVRRLLVVMYPDVGDRR